MCCNQQIRGFSAGQKVRLSLAAMFWTKPHFIAVDEPTNYLDVETVEALAKALNNFRGGILMIEPKMDFVEKVCNETWTMEDGKITVQKLDNGLKRIEHFVFPFMGTKVSSAFCAAGLLELARLETKDGSQVSGKYGHQLTKVVKHRFSAEHHHKPTCNVAMVAICSLGLISEKLGK
eukprot:g13068.t1